MDVVRRVAAARAETARLNRIKEREEAKKQHEAMKVGLLSPKQPREEVHPEFVQLMKLSDAFIDADIDKSGDPLLLSRDITKTTVLLLTEYLVYGHASINSESLKNNQ